MPAALKADTLVWTMGLGSHETLSQRLKGEIETKGGKRPLCAEGSKRHGNFLGQPTTTQGPLCVILGMADTLGTADILGMAPKPSLPLRLFYADTHYGCAQPVTPYLFWSNTSSLWRSPRKFLHNNPASCRRTTDSIGPFGVI